MSARSWRRVAPLVVTIALLGCGGIAVEEGDDRPGSEDQSVGYGLALPDGVEALAHEPAVSAELLALLEGATTRAYDGEGHPLLTFQATTIEWCDVYSAELKQSFCDFYNRCPELCGAAGYELLTGPVQQTCVATYLVRCVCTCE